MDLYKTKGGVAPACAILTIATSGFMKQFHERMPVIIEQADWDRWLDRSVTDTAAIADLLRSAPEDLLVAAPVSPRVADPKNNDAGLIEPAGKEIRP